MCEFILCDFLLFFLLFIALLYGFYKIIFSGGDNISDRRIIGNTLVGVLFLFVIIFGRDSFVSKNILHKVQKHYDVIYIHKDILEESYLRTISVKCYINFGRGNGDDIYSGSCGSIDGLKYYGSDVVKSCLMEIKNGEIIHAFDCRYVVFYS